MFDLDLLRTFLAVTETRHFTAAGAQRGLSQSTVSQHVRRLELACGRQLLTRDTHSVALTSDGAVLADLARDIVNLTQQATDYFAESTPRGRVRLGVSDDLALTRLPSLLRELKVTSPGLGVELTIGLTSMLYRKLDSGRLDLIFAKRLAGDDRGELIRRENLIWMAHRDLRLGPHEAVPLAVYPHSSITRTMMLEALNRVRRSWYVSCASETLAGLRAGAQAGLGVMAQSSLLIQLPDADLVPVSETAALPELGTVDFVVLGRCHHLQGAAGELAALIAERGPSLW
jgi:DNA-binding transcriptional LysR family regulator